MAIINDIDLLTLLQATQSIETGRKKVVKAFAVSFWLCDNCDESAVSVGARTMKYFCLTDFLLSSLAGIRQFYLIKECTIDQVPDPDNHQSDSRPGCKL